ncbi:MAG: hypothetical protein GXP62_06130 [Oligoflexia bacterium]|nr:hypothetical protein [Oligoflexia bacterium]
MKHGRPDILQLQLDPIIGRDPALLWGSAVLMVNGHAHWYQADSDAPRGPLVWTWADLLSWLALAR